MPHILPKTRWRALTLSSSSSPASVGLFEADGRCLWSYVESSSRTGEGLLAAIARHRENPASKPDLIIVDRGPGQFSGLRVGLGLAQGLAMGWGLPVLALDSAAIMANWALQLPEAAGHTGGLVSLRDARLGAFYGARFAAGCASLAIETAMLAELSLSETLALLLAVQAEEGALRLVTDQSSMAKLTEVSALAGLIDNPSCCLIPQADQLLASAAQLGFEALQAGARLLRPDQLEAYYVRNDVAMDLVAQRAYRRAQDDASKSPIGS